MSDFSWLANLSLQVILAIGIVVSIIIVYNLVRKKQSNTDCNSTSQQPISNGKIDSLRTEFKHEVDGVYSRFNSQVSECNKRNIGTASDIASIKTSILNIESDIREIKDGKHG